MFRAFRYNLLVGQHGTHKRWFKASCPCHLLACRGDVAGTASQTSFRPLTGLVQMEYAKSSRSNCAMCGFGIQEGSLRVGTFHQGTGDFAIAAWQHPRCFRSMTLPLYPDMLEYKDEGIALAHMSAVKEEDRDDVAKLLTDDNSCTWDTLLGKVLTSSELGEFHAQLAAARVAHEALAQWGTYDLSALTMENTSPKEAARREAALKKKKPDRDHLISRVSSLLLFGPLAPCEACDGGELIPNDALGAYRCSGHFDAFTRCGAVVEAKRVQRVGLKFPMTLKNHIAEIMKAVGMSEPFKEQMLVGHIFKQSAAKWFEARRDAKVADAPVARYAGMTFFKTACAAADTHANWDVIAAGGGTIVPQPPTADQEGGAGGQDGSKHVVQTLQEQAAKSLVRSEGIPIVNLDWIKESSRVRRPLTVTEGYTYYEEYSRPPAADAKWVQGLKSRDEILSAPTNAAVSGVPSSPSSSAQHQQQPTTGAATESVIFSGSAPVDAASNLASTHSVFHTDDLPWSATLSSVDLSTDKNSFYVLQLLSSSAASAKPFVVFRRWGRLGDSLKGGSTEEVFHHEHRARQKFAKYFLDRTDNEWEPLSIDHARKFVKKPGKYSWVDPPVGDGDEDSLKAPSQDAVNAAAAASAAAMAAPPAVILPRETEKLLELLFDEDSIQRSMATMNIDTKKMPLPGLNARAVKEGRAVLQQLMRECAPLAASGVPQVTVTAPVPDAATPKSKKAKATKSTTKESKKKGRDQPSTTQQAITNTVPDEQRRQKNILSLSNQFYSHIPHVRTEAADTFILNSQDKISSKFQLLEDLEDILTTKKLLMKSSVQPNHRLVSHYQALNINLEPLSLTATDEGKMVATYFKNSHGESHRAFNLRQLWRLERHGEAQRFDPWKSFPNRKLLWHGSRLTNWVRILTTGLKIAPPDAPVSGYMFGKGIYFADMISKSANYCNIDHSSNDGGLLILAEVALGTPITRYQSDYITDLPSGTHSTYAIGQTMPDPSQNITLPSGIVVPSGRPVKQPEGYSKCSLRYNEFIVYDITQVRLRYLLHVD